jgi:pyruvate/2-oxoglutarate/acetoin dehydrogenase E1 component
MMRQLTYRQAINETLDQLLAEDESVFLLGEDIGLLGGAFQVTKGLFDKYGPERVRNTPISESAIIGAAIGASCMGLKPIAEIMFCDFFYICMDQLVNQMAKMKYMYGGKAVLPIVVRTTYGAGLSSAAQHAQSNESLFLHIAGLKIAVPSTAGDAVGLLRASVADPNPVLFYEHRCLYDTSEAVPDSKFTIPLGQADVKRSGTDITIVATGMMVHRALEAAEKLEERDIDVEVVDPRTIAPLDVDTIIASARKTKRVMVVHEAPKTGGLGAEIASRIHEGAHDCLLSPVMRVCGKDTPVPFAPVLERAVVPQTEDIVDGAIELVSSKG